MKLIFNALWSLKPQNQYKVALHCSIVIDSNVSVQKAAFCYMCSKLLSVLFFILGNFYKKIFLYLSAVG